MCLFPTQNLNIDSPSYRKGVTTFSCGCCPECLSKKANAWALRAVYEAKEHVDNCMITLTYDNYVYDGCGRVVGERVSDLNVCKRDVQLFVKRLRKRLGYPIKYLISAEYGKRTHRAHYHAILFGVKFPDLVLYKRSKRGNYIYKSALLTDIWHNGICTVDSVNITSSVARYCTKYCMKDAGADDTFMLFSHGIGEKGLLRDFNGRDYIVDGRQHSVPRFVWQKVITERYSSKRILPYTYKYVNRRKDVSLHSDFRYLQNRVKRQRYYELRDGDPQYKAYVDYWRKKFVEIEKTLPSIRQRILSLNPQKYSGYISAALYKLGKRMNGYPLPPPRSSRLGELEKWRNRLRIYPCHKCANDTFSTQFAVSMCLKHPKLRYFDVAEKYFEIFS